MQSRSEEKADGIFFCDKKLAKAEVGEKETLLCSIVFAPIYSLALVSEAQICGCPGFLF